LAAKAFAAAAVGAVALLAAGSAQTRPQVSAGPLGVTGDGTTNYLVRLNAKNLRPLPGQRLELGPWGGDWAYSPDKATLAVELQSVTTDPSTEPTSSFRFVSVASLAPSGDLSLGSGYTYGAFWPAPDRLIAIVGHCCRLPAEVVVVDPLAMRVLDRSRLAEGNPLWVRRGGDRLVVMSVPAARIGPVALTAIDARGAARTLTLDRIDGGFEPMGAESQLCYKSVAPGLAVKPDGSRAFVVSPNGLVADVDLQSLSVAYHSLGIGRTVAAVNKRPVESVSRMARVLPNGFLAVTGWEDHPYTDSGGGEHTQYIRAGLALVDTSTWATTIVDDSTDWFAIAGNTLLATGSRGHTPGYTTTVGATPAPMPPGAGLTGYSLGGTPRFHRFKDGEVLPLQIYGNRAFVYVDGSEPDLLKVVDIRSGKIVGTRAETTLPWILQGASSVSR